MEPVLADLVLDVVLMGNWVCEGVVRHGLMEARVKYSHLRDFGEELQPNCMSVGVARHLSVETCMYSRNRDGLRYPQYLRFPSDCLGCAMGRAECCLELP